MKDEDNTRVRELAEDYTTNVASRFCDRGDHVVEHYTREDVVRAFEAGALAMLRAHEFVVAGLLGGTS